MKQKPLLSNAKIIDLSLYFPREKLLVLGDLHLGFEDYLIEQGTFIPRMNFSQVIEHLEKIFKKIGRVKSVLIIGDLKHEFGRISGQEWQEVIDLLNFLQKNCSQIILLKGNHDNILGPIAKWKNLELKESFYLPNEKILFLHGHKIPESEEFKQAKTLIIGHEHTAIVLRDKVKGEKFKCFLKGKFLGKNLIALPSFNFVALGANVLGEKMLSPFLQKDLSEFEVWAIEDKVYYFGRIKDL